MKTKRLTVGRTYWVPDLNDLGTMVLYCANEYVKTEGRLPDTAHVNPGQAGDTKQITSDGIEINIIADKRIRRNTVWIGVGDDG